MADNDRLGYAQGILTQLRASYAQMSHEELLDLVCHLQKSYVLDQTIPFDFPLPERAEELRGGRPDRPDAPDTPEDDPTEPADIRFGRLIDGLKRRTGLSQFEGFALEEGRAVLVVDNQKVTFGERVTVEFVPVRAPREPAPARPPTPPPPSAPPPAASAPAASAPAEAPPSRQPRKPPPPTGRHKQRPVEAEEPKQDGYDTGAERFRRLDLD